MQITKEVIGFTKEVIGVRTKLPYTVRLKILPVGLRVGTIYTEIRERRAYTRPDTNRTL